MERIMDFHNCWSAPNLLPHPTTWWHNGHKSLPAPPLFPRSSTTRLPGYSEVIFISFQRRTNLTHEEQLLDSGWCYLHLWLPWPVNPWIKSFIGFSSSSSIRVTRGPGTYLSNWSQWTSGKSKDLHCVGPEFHEIWGTKHCPPLSIHLSWSKKAKQQTNDEGTCKTFHTTSRANETSDIFRQCNPRSINRARSSYGPKVPLGANLRPVVRETWLKKTRHHHLRAIST